jgi:hypothetical protein
MARDALVQSKDLLREIAFNHIGIKGGLYDKLQPDINKLYLPIARLNTIISYETERIELEVE